MQITCPAEIAHVTVHARGAVVTRIVTVHPKSMEGREGAIENQFEVEVRVPGLTPLADPGSLRATLATGPSAGGGGRQVVSVRSQLVIPDQGSQPGPAVVNLDEVGAKITRLEAELERLTQQRQRLVKTSPDPALRTTSFVEKVDERMADALATAGLLLEAQQQIDRRIEVIERDLEAARSARAAAELAYVQAQSSDRMGRSHPSRCAIVSLSGRGPVPSFSLTYVVPAARFWPLYTLRVFDGPDGNRRATWLIEALVAQRTGEDWTQVRLSLSTADLLLDARLPELASLRLGRAQAVQRRGYRPPPAGLDALFAGYDLAFADVAAPDVGGSEETTGSTITMRDGLDGMSLGGMPADKEKSSRVQERLRTGHGRSRGEAPAKARKPSRAYDMDEAEGGGGGQGAPEALADMAPPPAPAMAAPPMPPPMMSMMPPGGPMPPGAPMPMGAAMPGMGPPRGGGGGADLRRAAGPPMAKKADGFAPFGSDEDAAEEAAAPPIEPAEAWLDFDRLVLAGASDRRQRGRLIRSSDHASATAALPAREQIEQLAPGGGVADPLVARGQFDHRYDSDGMVRVPSDGQAHRIVISSVDSVPALRLITVPREGQEVYREAELRNPSNTPLLGGPVDVYVEGSLLTTAQVGAIDRGGTLRVGMGVEERVRVARNVRGDEEAAGLLGGSTQVTHHVSIELSSALGQAVQVDVLDRLPVTDDKSMTIDLVSARPEAREYTQADRGLPIRGGLQWRVALPPGGKSKIEYTYRVVFPARTEIVGGNRRD